MVPKVLPQVQPQKRKAPRLSSLERWGAAPGSSWLAPALQRPPVNPSPPRTQTLTVQTLSITLCVDPQRAAPELPGGLPPPPGHSASSSRPAATKTRRRGTCALGTGATLAAKLGMLSRLSGSGWPGGKSEPGRRCSVGIGGGMSTLLMGRSSCRYQSLVPLARPGLFQAGLKGGGRRGGMIKSLPAGHPQVGGG